MEDRSVVVERRDVRRDRGPVRSACARGEGGGMVLCVEEMWMVFGN